MRYLLLLLLLLPIVASGQTCDGNHILATNYVPIDAIDKINWTNITTTAAGTLDSITMKIISFNSARNWRAAVYTAGGGSLLDSSLQFTIRTTAGTGEDSAVAMELGAALDASTDYAVALWAQGATFIDKVYIDTSGANETTFVDNEDFANAWPASLAKDSQHNDSGMIATICHSPAGATSNYSIHEIGQTASPIHGKGEVSGALHSK